jgi:hypothetical protein
MTGTVFRRLYSQSTAKKPDSSPAVEAAQPSLNEKSIHIAQSRQVARIRAAFGDREFATREELVAVLTNLGIFRDCSESDISLINGVINRCRADDSRFSATMLQQKVVDAVVLSRHHKFQVLVNTKLTIAHANEKTVAQPERTVETPVKMRRSTLERLVAPRSTETPKPKATRKPSKPEAPTPDPPKEAIAHQKKGDAVSDDSCEEIPALEKTPAKTAPKARVSPMEQSWVPAALPAPRPRKPWMSMEEIENRVRRKVKAAEQKKAIWH